MNAVAAEAMIERAGRALIDAASMPARVILFGSHARGDADEGSDFDFLVIEREVDDRLAEAVKLRGTLRGFGPAASLPTTPRWTTTSLDSSPNKPSRRASRCARSHGRAGSGRERQWMGSVVARTR
jgi:predicted nucleotidyltransferase